MIEGAPRKMEALIGTERRLGDGTVVKVDAKGKQLSYVPPSDTANHEFEHAALAMNKLIKVSVIPGPGYLGITEMDSYDEVAFLGPESRGRKGTGHDVSVVESQGGNVGAGKMQARINLAAINSEVQRKVAGHLQAEGTLTREGFKNAMRIAEQGTTVETTIITPDGRTIVQQESGVQGESIIVDFRNAIEEKNDEKNDEVEKQNEKINSIERYLYGEKKEESEEAVVEPVRAEVPASIKDETPETIERYLEVQRQLKELQTVK